jgi:hypothetical protein
MSQIVVPGKGVGVDHHGPGADLAGELVRVPDEVTRNTHS